MTTLAALVQQEPAATGGNPIDFAYDVGSWRMVYELADPAAGAGVVWHDISDYVLGWSGSRGAGVYAGRPEAAVVNVELMAVGDTLAPYNSDTSATFGTHVDLGPGLLLRCSAIRVVSAAVVEWVPRWTCAVEYWGDASYARGQIRRHLIVARDTFTSLVDVPIVAAVEEDWTDRLVAVLASAGWQYASLVYWTSSLTLPARDEQSSAVSELDTILDPVGLRWFTDRTGRLVVMPQVGDTFHPDALTLPSIHFHFLAEATTSGIISYATDNAAEPLGLSKTEDAVRNRVVVSSPAGVYDNDNPTSVQRYGPKVYRAAWVKDNDSVADDILAYRANATVEATPFVTTSDMAGFYDLLLADYMWPVDIDYRAGADEPGVAATGHVRRLEESVRHHGAVAEWSIRTTIDVATYSDTLSMFPVEDLAVSDLIDVAAEFTWTNPGGQPIAPTHTQVRMLNLSSLWVTIAYPTTVYSWGTLTPDTSYAFQVRLVEFTGSLITAFSPTRQVAFTTLSADDTPGTGGPGGDVDVPIGGCLSTAWELQEFNPDGTSGWEVIASGTTSTSPVDVSAFVVPGGVYRMRTNRCSEGWVIGPSWVEPGDWVTPCTTPPAFADPPFDHADLELYLPKICSPNTVREAISDTEAVKGPAFTAITSIGGQPAIYADTQGTVLYGFGSSAVNALVTDASLLVRVRIGAQPVGTVTLATAAGLSIKVTADGAGFGVSGTADEEVGGNTTISGATELALDQWYYLALVHDEAAGSLDLYVDGVSEANAPAGVTSREISVTAAYDAALPADSYVTDVGLWSVALDVADLPVPNPAAPNLAAMLPWHMFFQADSLVGVVADGADVPVWDDLIGSNDLTGVTRPLLVESDPAFNGAPTVRWDDGNTDLLEITAATHGAAQAQPYTIVVVAKLDGAAHSTSTIFDGGGASNRSLVRLSGTAWGYFAGGTVRTGGAHDTAAHVFSAFYNGASSRLKVSGVAVSSGISPGTHAFDGLRLGYGTGAGTTNFKLHGRIFAVGVYYGDAEAHGNWAAFLSAVAAYTGVT